MNGSCLDLTEEECTVANESHQGDGVGCESTSYPAPTGTCCDDSCSSTTQTACNGTWLGPFIDTCDPDPCIFNNLTGNITIVKKTDPPGGTGFGFSGQLGNYTLPSFSVDHGDSLTFIGIPPGSYSVSEPALGEVLGYWLTKLECVDGNATGTNSTVDLANGTATINLDLGETVTCTFINSLSGACCLPEGEGECGYRDQAACIAEGGIWNGNTTCEELPDGFCTAGACCGTPPVNPPGGEVAEAPNNGLRECWVTIASECNGPWNPTLRCEPDTCHPPGACILDDGKCQEISRIECDGKWIGGPCPKPVPTVTEWGLIVMALLLVGSAAWAIVRRKRTS